MSECLVRRDEAQKNGKRDGRLTPPCRTEGAGCAEGRIRVAAGAICNKDTEKAATQGTPWVGCFWLWMSCRS